MKKVIVLTIILIIGAVLFTAYVVTAQDTVIPTTTAPVIDLNQAPAQDPGGFLGVGWDWIAFYVTAVIYLLGAAIPTLQGNKWISWLLKIINFLGLPDAKKGGGTHSVNLWHQIWTWFKDWRKTRKK